MARPFFRHPAHPPPVRRHNEPVIVLVTVCVACRREILNQAPVRDALLSAWHDAGDWVVGTYVVMPDHVHVFCAPAGEASCSPRHWAGYWKRQAGEREQSLRRQFQADCWDVQMRRCAAKTTTSRSWITYVRTLFGRASLPAGRTGHTKAPYSPWTGCDGVLGLEPAVRPHRRTSAVSG